MKTQVKAFAAAVLLSGIVFNAVSQINLNASTTTFREYNSPTGFTYHYGDLQVIGGSTGTTWGWFTANRIYSNGFANIYGDLNVSGSKNFIHPHPTNESKLIRYVAIESGEALTMARGTAKTVNGQVTIELPEHFSLVTNKTEPLTVILTPKGAPAVLYTKESNREKVLVAMKASDYSEFRDVEFAYQITGIRDGFENQEVIIDEDKLDSANNIREDVQKRIDAFAERSRAKREEKK